MTASVVKREKDLVDIYLDKIAYLAVKALERGNQAAELRSIVEQISTCVSCLPPRERSASLKEFSAVLALYTESRHIGGIARLGVFADAKLFVDQLVTQQNS